MKLWSGAKHNEKSLVISKKHITQNSIAILKAAFNQNLRLQKYKIASTWFLLSQL